MRGGSSLSDGLLPGHPAMASTQRSLSLRLVPSSYKMSPQPGVLPD